MEGTMGEIRLFAGNFAPQYWMFCAGQLLSINNYQALYSLLGTYYGGDGRSTFALPDLRSRVPVGVGQAPGCSNYALGQQGGYESVVLTQAQMPVHTHGVQSHADSTLTGTIDVKQAINTDEAEGSSPANMVLAKNPNASIYAEEATADQFLKPAQVSHTLDVSTAVSVQVAQTGGNNPVYNVQPYLGMNYIICVNGIYPSRS